jgi:hypothetical protein
LPLTTLAPLKAQSMFRFDPRRVCTVTKRALVVATAAAGALAGAPQSAAASPTLASLLKTYTSSTEPKVDPPRTYVRALCHTGADGKCEDSFYNPLGVALRDRLGCPLQKTLITDDAMAAYAALEAEQGDLDCDGFPDFVEIRAGTDPSVTSSHPSGEPPLASTCSPGGAGGAGAAGSAGGVSNGGDGGGEGEEGSSQGKVSSKGNSTKTEAGSCAFSTPGRPLDPEALFLTALVALPLVRRTLRPRRRGVLSDKGSRRRAAGLAARGEVMPKVAVYAHVPPPAPGSSAVPTDSLALWVGACDTPAADQVTLFVDGQRVENPRPLRPMARVREGGRAFVGSFALDGRSPRERVTVQAEVDGVRSPPLTTQPLPAEVDGAFRVLLGSCYCRYEDPGVLGGVLDGWLTGPNRPHLTILGGDQVYLDQPVLENYLTGEAELARRFEDAYIANWFGAPAGDQYGTGSLASLLSTAPLVCLPDDHEYWNNYPEPTLVAGSTLSGAKREAWKAAASKSLGAFQHAGPGELPAARRLRVPPLSFLFLDTRSARDSASERDASTPAALRVLPDGALAEAERWRDELAPGDVGVVVTPQSLVEPSRSWFKGKIADWELANYGDYAALWQVLVGATERQAFVVLLTGDVHWGRVTGIFDTRLARTTMLEVISSPISLVTTPVVDWFKSLSHGNDPWPRWGKSAPPPNYVTYGEVSSRLRTEMKYELSGDQLCLLEFRRSGARTELEIKYQWLRADKLAPPGLAPLPLKL